MGAMIAVTLAIQGIAWIFDKLNVTIEEQEEVVEGLTDKLSGLKDEYDELSSKSDLSGIEQNRLDFLKRQIDLNEELLKQENEKLALKKLYGTGSFSMGELKSTTISEIDDKNIQNHLNQITSTRKSIRANNDLGLSVGDDYNRYLVNKEYDLTQSLQDDKLTLMQLQQNAFDNIALIQGVLDSGYLDNNATEKAKAEELLEFNKKKVDELDGYIKSIDFTINIDVNADDVKGKLQNIFGNKTRYQLDNGEAQWTDKELEYLDTLSDEELKFVYSLEDVGKLSFEDVKKQVEEFRKSSEEEIEIKTDIKSTIEAVEGLSDGFGKLSSIYEDIRNKGDFDFGSLVDKDFVNIFGNYKNEYQSFIETVSKSPTDIQACQSAFDNLVSAWIEGSGILDIVTEENKSLIATMLEAQGVGNASAIVDYALAKSKEEAFFKTNDLTDASTDEINALIAEAKAAGLSESAIYKLRLALVTANDSKLDFSQQIEAIKNIGLQAGVTAAQIAAMNAVVNANSQVKMYSSGTARRLTNSGKVKDSELAGMSEQLTAQAQATVAKQAAKEMYAAIADIAAPQIDFPTGNYTPKSPSGSGSKGSGGGSSSKDPYVADIDKYKDLTDAVDEVESKIKQLNQVYDHTDSLAGQIALKDKLIGLYKEEQDALTALNNARDKEISQNVKELRSVGFKIEYDPKTDNLKIKNREHLNSLSQDTIQKYEKLLKATEDLNDANKESAEKWTELTYAIADVGKEITELRIKQYDAFVRDKEHLIDLLSNRKDTVGKDLSIYDDLMKNTLRTWYDLVQDGYEKNKEQIQDLEKSWMDYYDARIEREKELLEKQLDDHDKALNGVLDFIDKQLEGLDDQIDALKKINDERREALELQKAQIALDKARNQRTMKVLRKGKGYVYEADEDAIKQAEEDLADKQYEASVKQLEKQKENLEELKKVWSEIPNLFEKYQNELLASQILGADWEQKILDGREDAYEDFKDAYFDLQEEIQNKSDELENHMNQSYINMVEIFRKMADLYGNMNNMSSGRSWYVNKDGKAPSQAQKGDIIYTKGGTYQITGKDENGKFTSTKLDDKSTDVKDGKWGTLVSDSNTQLGKAIGSNTISNQNIVDTANKQIDTMFENITGMEAVSRYLANNTFFTQEEINTLAKQMGITDINTGAINTNVGATDANTDSQNENTESQNENTASLNNATGAMDDLSRAIANLSLAQAEADEYIANNNMKQGVSNEGWLNYWNSVLDFAKTDGSFTQADINNALAQRNKYQELVNQEKAIKDAINGVTDSTIKVDLSDEDKEIIRELQKAYNTAKAAGNEQGMKLAHQLAEAVRNGFDISPITSKPDYKLSDTTYTGGASASTGNKSNLQKEYERILSFGNWSDDYTKSLESAIARETWGSGHKFEKYTDEFGRTSTIITPTDPSELNMTDAELKNRYYAGWRPVNDGMDKLGGNLKETNSSLSDTSDAMYDSSDKIDSSADKIVDSNNNVVGKLDSLENAISNANFGGGYSDGGTSSSGPGGSNKNSGGRTITGGGTDVTGWKAETIRQTTSKSGNTTWTTTKYTDPKTGKTVTTTVPADNKKKKAKGGINLLAGTYNIDELGAEFVIEPEQGRYARISYGGSVIPADVSKTLWDFGADPNQFMQENVLKNLKFNTALLGATGTSIVIEKIEANLPDVRNVDEFARRLPDLALQYATSRTVR